MIKMPINLSNIVQLLYTIVSKFTINADCEHHSAEKQPWKITSTNEKQFWPELLAKVNELHYTATSF